MLEGLKQSIKEKLHNRCITQYSEQVEILSDSYRQWYLSNEEWKKAAFSHKKSCRLIAMQSIEKGFVLQKNLPSVIVFYDSKGQLEEASLGLIGDLFAKHKDTQIAYADEDELDVDGRRINPWFKPCWSPDTLESFQYFGHIFAVRTKLLELISEEEWMLILKDNYEENCYRMILLLCDKIRQSAERQAAMTPPYEQIRQNPLFQHNNICIRSIDKVLIHMPEGQEDVEHRRLSEEEDAIRVASAPRPKKTYKWTQTMEIKTGKKRSGMDMPASLENGDDIGARKHGYAGEESGVTIAAVIPSKDHPEILEVCLSSLREKTNLSGIRLEIIVVDNGSSNENKEVYEKLSEQYDFYYHYAPMDFNFSKMCNLGVGLARSEYVLLLNDDMEIIQGNWLQRLLAKACQPHAGAVGAKLLYPDSDIMQHIGITNIMVGPVHKLLKKHDNEYHYHGQNRHVYDMIGVTAACLLVKKEKYDRVGGFNEEMQVAYNDVDFCFSLYEAGYYNIQRNDVILYHHESLSRGDDNMSDAKWERLLKEKDILYNRHPALKSKDPFYSRNLACHSNLYIANHRYPYEMRDYYTRAGKWKKAEPVAWENGCLTLNVEHARMEKKLEFTEKDDVYWIEGWSYVLGMDNSHYRRKLLLTGTKGNRYLLEVLDRYRKDVVDILPEQTNVALAGFTVRVPKGAIPEDDYTIAMICYDKCSNQKLYAKSDMLLEAHPNRE